MILWLWCLIWGHKTMLKACVGETFQTVNQVTGLPQTGHYWVWRRSEFCVRCGTKIWETQEVKEPKGWTRDQG